MSVVAVSMFANREMSCGILILSPESTVKFLSARAC